MKTPEEIKKGLEYISTTNIARKVVLAKAGRMPYAYTEEVAADAITYIRQLETELIQVRSERDAAIADLKDALDRGDAASFCEFCRHNDDWGKCEHPCNAYSGETGWEWRGLPEPPKEEVG